LIVWRERDDKEDKHLSAVIREAVLGMKAGKGDQSQVSSTEHELKTHENDDDISADNDARETNRKEKSRKEEVFVE